MACLHEGDEMNPPRSTRLRIRKHFSPENDATLFHGDCLALLKRIPDESVALIVTSPPYNIGKSYERRISIESYLANQEQLIDECVRVLKPGGSICWQVGNHVFGDGRILPLDIAIHPIFSTHESLRLRNRIVWHFEHGLHCTYRFSGRHETILWYTKGDKYPFNLDAVRTPQKYPGKRAYKGANRGEFSGHPLGKNPSDVWVFPNVKGNHIEKTAHPCQFPIELPERLVLALTKMGDLVMDPYLGVGTTAVAAVMHSRRAAGADIQSDFLQIAKERLVALASGDLPYRQRGTPVYVPKPNSKLTTSPFRHSGVNGVVRVPGTHLPRS